MRERTAAGPMASASTGSTYDEGPSRPATGNQPRLTAKTQTSATPTRKSGTAPSTTLVEEKASSVRRRRPRLVATATATPSGMATATATTKASRASEAVAGRRWLIVWDTGSCETIDS